MGEWCLYKPPRNIPANGNKVRWIMVKWTTVSFTQPKLALSLDFLDRLKLLLALR